MASSTSKQSKRPSGPWLNAWHHQLAGLRCFSSCMAMADLHAKGENQLVVADQDSQLKVFKGTSIVSQLQLPDMPTAVAVFHPNKDARAPPCLAVASGPHVFIYRNMRAFYKFVAPEVPVSSEEKEVWSGLAQTSLDIPQAIQTLVDLRDGGIALSHRSLDLLALEDEELQASMVKANNEKGPPRQDTVVTCMTTLRCMDSDQDHSSCLVVGTENQQIIILEPSGTKTRNQLEVGGVPHILTGWGELEVDWRLAVACRDGRVYSCTCGEVRGSAVLKKPVIELESQPVAMAKTSKGLFIGTMDRRMTCFTVRGKKQYSIRMPSEIMAMETMPVHRDQGAGLFLVALKDGQVRLYRDKALVHALSIGDCASALAYGRYGREDHTLAVVSGTGALSLKMLQRTANLEGGSEKPGPPAEQDIPLAVPKKTSLYVDSTHREKLCAKEMHRAFQNDLCRLRLETARAYVQLISDGQMGDSPAAGTTIRLNAQVQGLGPFFKLRVELLNGGPRPVADLRVVVTHPSASYRLRCPQLPVPLLLPGIVRFVCFNLECLEPNAPPNAVRVAVVNTGSPLPLVTATVKMPQLELLDD